MSTESYINGVPTTTTDWLMEGIRKPFNQITELQTVYLDNQEEPEVFCWVSTKVGENAHMCGSRWFAKVGQRKSAADADSDGLKFTLTFECENFIGNPSLVLMASAHLDSVAEDGSTTSLCRTDWMNYRHRRFYLNPPNLSLTRLRDLAGQDGNLKLRVSIAVKLGPELEDGGDFLRSIFTSGYLSDFKIKVNETTIAVHRVILGKKSSVFDALFNSTEWAENRNGVLEILGFPENAVIAMLEHLYCFPLSFDNQKKQASDVLALAEKYNLSALKKQCETSLENLVNLQNVCQLAVHADLHSASSLKAKCIGFAAENGKALTASPDWKELKESNYRIALEIAEEAMKK